MNKEELWDAYCARNPQFAEPGKQITLTSDGIKKLFEQTWEIAEKAAKEEAEKSAAWREKIRNMGGKYSNPFGF